MRVLSLRELNRTLLLRQLLLERAPLTPTRAVERVAALQAQWVPSPYVALWSRIEGFERDGLTRALGRGTVLKASLMRESDSAWPSSRKPPGVSAARNSSTTRRIIASEK